MTTLIAACGLDCSKCEAYLATQAGDVLALEAIAEKWRKEYNAPSIAADNILCDGCTEGGRTIGHCAECKVRLCALERGYKTCAECPDYACEELTNFFKILPPLAKENLDALRG